MTAREILRSYLEANKEVTNRQIVNLLIENGYSISTAQKTISEALFLGWLKLKTRNRAGQRIYISTIFDPRTIQKQNKRGEK